MGINPRFAIQILEKKEKVLIMKTQPIVDRNECLRIVNDVVVNPVGKRPIDKLRYQAQYLMIKAYDIAADRGHCEHPLQLKSGTWEYNFYQLGAYLQRLADCWDDSKPAASTRQAIDIKPAFVLFKKGNSKLPFYSWSTLPAVTCPGAGDCLNWCYSFTSWRYPAAFARQIQNSILINLAEEKYYSTDFNPAYNIIETAFLNLPDDVVLRLYVDGDFSNWKTIRFWFTALTLRPDVDAYGYSKSWADILEYFTMSELNGLPVPDNYYLNVSNGSKYDHDDDIQSKIMALPITRGRFVAVDLDGKYEKGFAKKDNREYHKEVRDKIREQYPDSAAFSCPMLCGECTMKEHACGSGRFDKVVIGIGIHN